MSQPIRIQRKRTKGFNLQAQSPDGRPVVSVCRPGKWGNPFKAGERVQNNAMLIGMGHEPYGWREDGEFDLLPPYDEGLLIRDVAHSLELYREYLAFFKNSLKPADLAGKHLACFCALDAPCHADVLLELANRPALPIEKETKP